MVSALAIMAALLGGAAGSASSGMGAGMAGSVGLISEPPSMVLTTTNGAQILVVQDPATGAWINSETGNLVDIGRHEEFVRQQEQTLAQQRARNAELERTGQTSMQQGFDEIEQKYQREFDAIQKEIDERRREQLAREQENLEWEQKQAQRLSSIGRIAGDGLIGAADDTAELIKTSVEKAVRTGEKMGKWIAGTVRDPQKLVNDIGDAFDSAKKSLGEAKDSVMAKAEEIRNNPWLVVEGVMEGGKAVIDFARSPKKQWEFVKSVVGIDDFIASQDPNLSIGERVEKVLSGTFKLGMTIGTSGAGGAGRTAATRGAGKLATVKGIKPSLPVKTGRNYVAAKRPANLRGMTKTAKKVVQNTADEMGLQIKARNIKSANAGRMIESGKAVPKRVNMKAKSLDILDEMLGGPKNSEGVVGYYKPKMPPKEVWKNLSPTTKAELTNKFKERSREFRKLAEPMKKLEAAGEYKLEGGLVRDLKQGGKYVTSDLDIHDIVNFDGTPVSESVKKEAYRKMMNYGKTLGKPPVQSTVMHEGTMSWTKTSDKIGYSEKVKQGLIDGATKEGPGKGITSINPLAKPTSEKYVR